MTYYDSSGTWDPTYQPNICPYCGERNDVTNGCKCQRGYYVNVPSVPQPQGWMCPACGSAHPPHVHTCPNKPAAQSYPVPTYPFRWSWDPQPYVTLTTTTGESETYDPIWINGDDLNRPANGYSH